jgi:Parvovirus non-structural protein NS1
MEEQSELFEDLITMAGAMERGELETTQSLAPSSSGGNNPENEGFDNSWMEAFEAGAGHILRSIQRISFTSGRRYFTDVVAGRDLEHARSLCHSLLRRAAQYKGDFIIISLHDDHVHIVHDCPYSNGSCRCKIYEGTEASQYLRRGSRVRPPIAGLGSGDFYNVLRYFSTGGRRILFCQVGGRVQLLPDGLESLQTRRHQGEAAIGTLETCDPENRMDVPQKRRSTPVIGEGKRARRDLGNIARRKDELQQKMEIVMTEAPCCPLANIVRTKRWLQDSDLMLMRDDDRMVKSLVDAWQSLVCSWNIHDFVLFYNQPNCKPLFHSGSMPVADVYYDLDTSLELINRLLRYQFNDNYDLITDFVVSLYNVCERKVAKLNSFLIFSPPSGGKNFFIDCIMDFYWNRGQLGNPNRFERFAFQEATNRRIILWNEPNYEASATDQLKMILGGDANTVRVKMKLDSAVYRTPVIILTNNHVHFMSDPAFKDRIVQYRWMTAPFLKEYDKKPTPMVWIELCKQFGLLE